MLNVYAAIATLTSFVEGRLNRDEKGATAVEYGLMVGLIAAVIITTVTTLGGQLDGLFQEITTALTPAG
ncbi:Flp family type IVb pilin [Blastococcus sp. HT6-30]|uniref:Flp family type IVb pilin n=1 Tax=Blastococcus sp. HT6-30 TaxID=3144843 RepID=UPI00321A9B6B